MEEEEKVASERRVEGDLFAVTPPKEGGGKKRELFCGGRGERKGVMSKYRGTRVEFKMLFRGLFPFFLGKGMMF